MYNQESYELSSDAAIAINNNLCINDRHNKVNNFSNLSFETLADAVPQIVWTSRSDGWLDYYNQRWVEYTGMTWEESQGWGWQEEEFPRSP